MNQKSAISIVIPAKDEADTIGRIVQDCITVCRENNIEHEVIVIDDGSKDETSSIARITGAIVINNDGQHGKGAALRLGFKRAKYDTIVMLDGDYSHRAEDIPDMLKEFRKGYGLVVGNRFIGGSDEYNSIRLIGNRLLTLIFCQLFSVHLNDAINGFKIFDKRIFDSFEYKANDFSIEIELLANTRALGLSIGQVHSHERARKTGRAKSLTFRHGFSFLSQIIKERITAKNKSALVDARTEGAGNV